MTPRCPSSSARTPRTKETLKDRLRHPCSGAPPTNVTAAFRNTRWFRAGLILAYSAEL